MNSTQIISNDDSDITGDECEIANGELKILENDFNLATQNFDINNSRLVTSIGSSESCDIRIPRKTLSSIHAIIESIDGQFFITDKNSRNRTFRNRKPLVSGCKYELRGGEQLKFADVMCIFRLVYVDNLMDTFDDGENGDESLVAIGDDKSDTSSILGNIDDVMPGDALSRYIGKESADKATIAVPESPSTCNPRSETTDDTSDNCANDKLDNGDRNESVEDIATTDDDGDDGDEHKGTSESPSKDLGEGPSEEPGIVPGECQSEGTDEGPDEGRQADIAVEHIVEKASCDVLTPAEVISPTNVVSHTQESTAKNENTPSDVVTPTKKEATPQKEAPLKKEATPQKEAPLKKEATPQKEAPLKKEVTLQKEAPLIKESTPQKEAPLKKEATPQKEAPLKKETTPTEVTTLNKNSTPTKLATPAKLATPTKEVSSAAEVSSIKETTLADEFTSVKEANNSRETTPPKEAMSINESTPAKEDSPQIESMLTKETTPTKEIAHPKEAIPPKETTPVEAINPLKEVTVTTETTSLKDELIPNLDSSFDSYEGDGVGPVARLRLDPRSPHRESPPLESLPLSCAQTPCSPTTRTEAESPVSVESLLSDEPLRDCIDCLQSSTPQSYAQRHSTKSASNSPHCCSPSKSVDEDNSSLATRVELRESFNSDSQVTCDDANCNNGGSGVNNDKGPSVEPRRVNTSNRSYDSTVETIEIGFEDSDDEAAEEKAKLPTCQPLAASPVDTTIDVEGLQKTDGYEPAASVNVNSCAEMLLTETSSSRKIEDVEKCSDHDEITAQNVSLDSREHDTLREQESTQGQESPKKSRDNEINEVEVEEEENALPPLLAAPASPLTSTPLSPSTPFNPSTPLSLSTPRSCYDHRSTGNRLLPNSSGGLAAKVSDDYGVADASSIEETSQATSIGAKRPAFCDSSFDIGDSQGEDSMFYVPSSLPGFHDSDIVKDMAVHTSFIPETQYDDPMKSDANEKNNLDDSSVLFNGSKSICSEIPETCKFSQGEINETRERKLRVNDIIAETCDVVDSEDDAKEVLISKDDITIPETCEMNDSTEVDSVFITNEEGKDGDSSNVSQHDSSEPLQSTIAKSCPVGDTVSFEKSDIYKNRIKQRLSRSQDNNLDFNLFSTPKNLNIKKMPEYLEDLKPIEISNQKEEKKILDCKFNVNIEKALQDAGLSTSCIISQENEESCLDTSLLMTLEGCTDMSSSQPILDISLPSSSQSLMKKSRINKEIKLPSQKTNILTIDINDSKLIKNTIPLQKDILSGSPFPLADIQFPYINTNKRKIIEDKVSTTNNKKSKVETDLECIDNIENINSKLNKSIPIEEENINVEINNSSELPNGILVLNTSESKCTQNQKVTFQDTKDLSFSKDSLEIKKSDPIKATRSSSRKRKSTLKITETIDSNLNSNDIKEKVKSKKKPKLSQISKKNTITEDISNKDFENNSIISQDTGNSNDIDVQNEIKDNAEIGNNSSNNKNIKKRPHKISIINSENKNTQNTESHSQKNKTSSKSQNVVVKPSRVSQRNKKMSINIENEIKLESNFCDDKISKLTKDNSNKSQLKSRTDKKIQAEKSLDNIIKEEPVKSIRSRRVSNKNVDLNVIKKINVEQENKRNINSSKDNIGLENIIENKPLSSSKNTRQTRMSKKIELDQIEKVLPKKKERLSRHSKNSICKKEEITIIEDLTKNVDEVKTKNDSPNKSFKSDIETPQVMLTGFDTNEKSKYEKIIKKMKWATDENTTTCTHLCTNNVKRTIKFLCCVSRGIPIVNCQWLLKSSTANKVVDFESFILNDRKSEKIFKFCLSTSLAKASSNLFNGLSIFVTKNVLPSPVQMKEIIMSAGGKFAKTLTNDVQYVITCDKDLKLAIVNKARKMKNTSIVNSEFILTGVLRQDISDLSDYLL